MKILRIFHRRNESYKMKDHQVRPIEQKTEEVKTRKNDIYFNQNNEDTNNNTLKRVLSAQKSVSCNDEITQIYAFIQGRLYLLSAGIGDTKAPFNRRKGYVGLLIWILHLVIHFSFDFYEASVVFHASWGSSIGIYLIMFLTCTVFIIRHTFRWYVRFIKKLSKEEIHIPTLKKLKFIFKYIPLLLTACAVTGAGAQYCCYFYDDALKISFGKTENGTTSNPVPEVLEIALNVLRFTSLSHIYYMMFLMLFLNMTIFYSLFISQKEFNAYIGSELKSHPPSMTFQQAVNRFADRTKLLHRASKSTTVVLTVLLLSTSVSFVVNAYNFLFIKRYAIYVWFAVAPLLWTVMPLIGGALVTSSYQKLKLIVMQSWVEIPEKYDEVWRWRTPNDGPKSPNPNWKACLANVRRKRELKEELEKKKIEENERKKKESHIININETVTTNRKQSVFRFIKRNSTLTAIEPSKKKKKNKKRRKTTTTVISEQSFCIRNEKVNEVFTLKNSAEMKIPVKEQEPKISSPQVTKSSLPNTQDMPLAENLKPTEKQITNEEDSLRVAKSSLPNTHDMALAENLKPTEKQITNEEDSPRVAKSSLPNTHDMTLAENLKPTEKQITNKEDSARVAKSSLPNTQDMTLTENLKPTEKQITNKEDRRVFSSSEELSKVVRIAQTVARFKGNIRRRKFNYEKYIKFLELTLDTIGFSLGNVTITWDRVSFFMVLLLTLVGVFAQNAFLK